jgi:hypothetical protein
MATPSRLASPKFCSISKGGERVFIFVALYTFAGSEGSEKMKKFYNHGLRGFLRLALRTSSRIYFATPLPTICIPDKTIRGQAGREDTRHAA